MKSFAQIKAIEKSNKNRWLKVCPTLTDESGIYILTREDERGFKFAYVGQAKHILTRLAQHLAGYDLHIDKSLKKHKLWSGDNLSGWSVDFAIYPESELNAFEQAYIKEYADMGYQLHNKTTGSQGRGKVGLKGNTCEKGYRKGVKFGYRKAQREVAHLFEKNLNYCVKKENKFNLKAFEKFNDFIRGENAERTEKT